jgi:hypothetical protein
MFLVSGASTLYVRGWCWVRWSRSFQEAHDQTANGLYFLPCAAWMFASLNQFKNLQGTSAESQPQDFSISHMYLGGFAVRPCRLETPRRRHEYTNGPFPVGA